MSLEALKEYSRRCATEPALKMKAKEIGLQDMQGQIEHARSLGLEWGPEDMALLAREMGADVELSEEQLESVAGGFITITMALVAGTFAGAAVAGGVMAAGAAVGVASAVTTGGQGW